MRGDDPSRETIAMNRSPGGYRSRVPPYARYADAPAAALLTGLAAPVGLAPPSGARDPLSRHQHPDALGGSHPTKAMPPIWMTFTHALEMGAHVRKGERGRGNRSKIVSCNLRDAKLFGFRLSAYHVTRLVWALGPDCWRRATHGSATFLVAVTMAALTRVRSRLEWVSCEVKRLLDHSMLERPRSEQ